MLSPLDYALWLIGPVAEVFVLVFVLMRKEFVRYLSLVLYISSLALSDLCRFLVMLHYGYQSLQYARFYYYTDALSTIIMYVAIMGLYMHAFRDSDLSKYVRGVALVILGATAAFSFLVVQHSSRSFGPFMIELSRNLYFIGVVMTYILWGTMLKLRVTRLRIVLIVSAFGLFFGLHAVTYTLRFFYPGRSVWKLIPPLVGTWLPLSLAYTFARVPEEAGMATADAAGVRN